VAHGSATPLGPTLCNGRLLSGRHSSKQCWEPHSVRTCALALAPAVAVAVAVAVAPGRAAHAFALAHALVHALTFALALALAFAIAACGPSSAAANDYYVAADVASASASASAQCLERLRLVVRGVL